MKNECSYVRDVLPLYIENMVREETGAFVREHLENCPECTAEHEALISGSNVDKVGSEIQSDLETDVRKAMKAARKKIRKRLLCTASIIAGIFMAVCILLHIFPVYRIASIGPIAFGDYYSKDQIMKALYIGSPADRREAQAVLRLADKAFHDVRHTRAENEEAYGLLARYATPIDSYDDPAFSEYTLELWSAHLEDDEGWIWVYYSSETFDHNGASICGSWRIPSLWKVAKNDSGEWTVVSIREHP